MSQNRVVAVGLESASLGMLQEGMEEGFLPNLARLKDQAAFGRLSNIDFHATETEWTSVMTGRLPESTGYWGPMRWRRGTYQYDLIGAYDFIGNRPFYALGSDFKTVAFDIPQSRLDRDVNGQQVIGWGAHDPQSTGQSHPIDLLPDLIARYGRHPALRKSQGDNWWDKDYAAFLDGALKLGLSRRSAIARELMATGSWDLFITAFGELHSAGHNFWHLNDDRHPLYVADSREAGDLDPLQATYRMADAAVGEIIDAAPEDAAIVLFDTLGMDANTNELPSKFFLGEFLYRYSFPGRTAFAAGDPREEPPPVVSQPDRKLWPLEIWDTRTNADSIDRLVYRTAPRAFYRLPARVRRLFEKGSSARTLPACLTLHAVTPGRSPLVVADQLVPAAMAEDASFCPAVVFRRFHPRQCART